MVGPGRVPLQIVVSEGDPTPCRIAQEHELVPALGRLCDDGFNLQDPGGGRRGAEVQVLSHDSFRRPGRGFLEDWRCDGEVSRRVENRVAQGRAFLNRRRVGDVRICLRVPRRHQREGTRAVSDCYRVPREAAAGVVHAVHERADRRPDRERRTPLVEGVTLRPHGDGRRRNHGEGSERDDGQQSQEDDARDGPSAPLHLRPSGESGPGKDIRFTYTLPSTASSRARLATGVSPIRAGLSEKGLKDLGPSAPPERHRGGDRRMRAELLGRATQGSR